MPPRCSWNTVSSWPIPSGPARNCWSGCKPGVEAAVARRDVPVVSTLKVQRDIDQANHRGNFHQRADNRRECLARIDPEHRDGYRDRQLEVVAGRGEGKVADFE